MKCPACGAKTKVADSRPCADDIQRTRECLNCERRFTTLEFRVCASKPKRRYSRETRKKAYQ